MFRLFEKTRESTKSKEYYIQGMNKKQKLENKRSLACGLNIILFMVDCV